MFIQLRHIFMNSHLQGDGQGCREAPPEGLKFQRYPLPDALISAGKL